MLVRTDPFREFDRLTQQALGTMTRPAVMPMDAWRGSVEVVVAFDLPGVEPDSIDIDVERNVLTVKAERRPPTRTPRWWSPSVQRRVQPPADRPGHPDTDRSRPVMTPALTLRIPIAEAKPAPAITIEQCRPHSDRGSTAEQHAGGNDGVAEPAGRQGRSFSRGCGSR
jgi:hypothetical protein